MAHKKRSVASNLADKEWVKIGRNVCPKEDSVLTFLLLTYASLSSCIFPKKEKRALMGWGNFQLKRKLGAGKIGKYYRKEREKRWSAPAFLRL